MRAGVIVLGTLAAGVVGALAGPLLSPPPDHAVAGDPDARSRIESRIDDLEREVVRLRAELSVPPVVPQTSPVAPVALGDGPAAIGGEPAAAVPAALPDDRIEVEVRKAIAERERAARDARAKAAAEKQTAKDEQFLTKLQNALELSDYQREELLGHLKTRRAVYARYKRAIADKSETDQVPLKEALRSFIADQDDEMTKLLGVDKFERLMELTTPKKR